MVVSADTITVFGKKQSLLLADELEYKTLRTPERSNCREAWVGLLSLESDDEVWFLAHRMMGYMEN